MIEENSFLKKRRFFSYRSKNGDFVFFSQILLIPLILVSISSLLILSIQRQSINSDSVNHLIAGLIGYFIAIFVSYIPLERIKVYVIPMYLLSLLTLILIYFFGITTYGAQRWLSVGLFTFQPSEITKLSTLLALAVALENKSFNSIKDLLIPFVIIIPPWILIFLQPDLGTSLVLIFLFLVMLYWVQLPVEWILVIICSVLTAIFSFISLKLLILWLPFMGFLAYKSFKNKKIFALLAIVFHAFIAQITPYLWNFALKDYQKDRLILFLDPGSDPLGGGYHLLQSKIGIGSGGLLGTGLLNGKLTNLNFIPEQHTDFIFSALGEELGFIGSLIVVFLLFFLVMHLLNISKNARTNFESLVVIGIASIFIFQTIINIYMTIGLGPVTGIPLPFMSYGRTAMFINFIFIGLALSTYKRSRSLRKR